MEMIRKIRKTLVPCGRDVGVVKCKISTGYGICPFG